MNNLNLAVEETLQLCFVEGNAAERNRIIREHGGIEMMLSFAEQTRAISLSFAADEALGTILNPVEETDGLSRIILSGITEQLEETVHDGKVVVTMTLK